MNYRYLLGRTLTDLEIACLTSPLARLLQRYPRGRHWPYDALRFGGRQPKVVFDVGANVGMTTTYLRRFFPDAHIHAFEPVAATFGQLKQALHGDPLAVPVRLALGPSDSVQEIEVDAFSQMSTLVRSANSTRLREAVQVSKLDTYRVASAIDFVDILKIDVQGYERGVLAGAETTFRERRIAFVSVEVAFHPGDRETAYFPEIHDLVRAQGFTLGGFYDLYRTGDRKQQLHSCSVLYQAQL